MLQRHRCRRRTWSGQLQCASMELLSLLRFCFRDVSMTSGIYIAFWHRVPQAFLFVSEPFIGVCHGFYPDVALTGNSLEFFFGTFLIFDVVSCCFCGFLMCNESWLSCIAIIMISDSLLDLMLCRNYDGIVFCRSCYWNCFLSRDEFSSNMFSNVFFNQFFWNFFAQMWCKNCTWSHVKLHLFSVSVEKND